MQIQIRTHLSYAVDQPCDVLMQIEAASDSAQTCRATRLMLDPLTTRHSTQGEDSAGARLWVTAGPQFECHYETLATVTRKDVDLLTLTETPRPRLPNEVIPYLMPSRYCQSDLFVTFVAEQFGHARAGALVEAIGRWVFENFSYDNGASSSYTTATDSFASLAGVCRDYAHVMIALLRAADIPARFVSAYAPDVVPQDFHAVVEVYLGGAWHLVDPTGMAKASNIVRICEGRDAADAFFLTSFGQITLVEQSVDVQCVVP